MHGPSGDAHFPRAEVDGQPFEFEHSGCVKAAASAKDRTDSSDELTRRDRFTEVVVGAQIEPDDAVHFVGASADDDDRDLAGGSHPMEHLKTAKAR